MSTTSSNSPQGGAATKDKTSIVGRGNKEGNQLFRDWYQELTTAESQIGCETNISSVICPPRAISSDVFRIEHR